MSETPLDIARIWVEFPDPEWQPNDRSDQVNQVFKCDLTWLTSNWSCIFGRGCPGIYDSRPLDGCCTLGAHFTDSDDFKRVRPFVQALTPQTWQRHPEVSGPLAKRDWTEKEDGTRKTKVVDGGCIFLNDPDFPAGGGCALHHEAGRRGLDAMRTKPDVCWQLPVRRTYRRVSRPDGSDYLEVSIAEYDRRGWGPGGHELDWYCTGNPIAHTGSQPVYRSLEPELRELMGDAAYLKMVELCEEVRTARPLLPLTIHPADPAT